MKIKNVVVAGGGVLGSQIAFQAAYCGFHVTIWLRSEGSIGRTQPKLDSLKQVYIDTINKMATPEGQTPMFGREESPIMKLLTKRNVWKKSIKRIRA